MKATKYRACLILAARRWSRREHKGAGPVYHSRALLEAACAFYALSYSARCRSRGLVLYFSLLLFLFSMSWYRF